MRYFCEKCGNFIGCIPVRIGTKVEGICEDCRENIVLHSGKEERP